MGNIPTTSTTLLRDLAQDSQHARWGEFVARYRPMMEAFMRERFPTLEADDVIQETLIELIRVFPIYHYSPKEKGHFHNYLTGILRHRALRMMGEEQRRAQLAEEMRRVSASVKTTADREDNAPYYNVGQAAAVAGAGRAACPQAAAARERFDNVGRAACPQAAVARERFDNAGRAACPQAAAEASPVLIDLGLAKDLSAVRGHAGESLSIVDGKALGVGTPRYAAPEQMSGDAVSPATDVYALGMLANDCFGGKPPRVWRRIIQRATAAIPAQRYATVAEFTRAIKLLRARYWIRGTLAVALTVSVLTLWTFSRKGENSPIHVLSATNPVTVSPTTETPNEKSAWQELCRNFTTNIVTRHTEMRRPDAVKRMSPAEFTMRANNPQYRSVLVSRAETNKIDATMVNLGGRTVLFNEPIKLDAGREYWIVGPGVLDAQFSASSTATVRIANCIFRNRTKTSPDKAGIDYVLDGGAYLNFTDLPSTEAMKLEVGGRVRSNGMSEGLRWWRIKGPDDIAELVNDE